MGGEKERRRRSQKSEEKKPRISRIAWGGLWPQPKIVQPRRKKENTEI